MNAFDKSRMSITAWCEDCECVFDNRLEVEAHRQEKGHRVKVTEFWVTGRR
ncbi:hypothetical protein [Nitrososphaera viennensis]|uniref:C2H2-type domain-containing protein n=1 Tax=Nitrososphaera viennensis TaxID=1034015 RepID=A0A977NNI7_9ARCH|nr:hypothetical protein [Nitrososphaera viennensis]UVS70581.1 hypothetical protein NWT39_07285 [Nitrososphaera viennensis]